MTRGFSRVRQHARVVAATGALLGVAATLSVHGVAFNPNRIVDGAPASLLAALGPWGWVLVGMWAAAAIIALLPLPDSFRGVSVSLLGGASPIVMVWRVAVEATAFAERTSDVARTSLLWASALFVFASYVVIYAATAWIKPGFLRAALTYLPVVGVALLLAGGMLGELAIVREYHNNADTFAREFRLHLIYVLGAVAIGLVAGLALGLLAAVRRGLEPAVFGTLNVLQVAPTLAFVGLMNPLLSSLSDHVPVLDALGVRGVGWAPVIIVLSAYAVYPIARNAHAALTSIEPSVVDAAAGMGMGRWRRLLEIELPLALPVIVAGLRIALVQTTAGAIVAGLVGGGGLGTFVFLGAGETATDLIMLGVLPIVALGLFFDRTAVALERAIRPQETLT